MPRTPPNLLLLTSLLVVTVASADPSSPPLHGAGSVVFTPAARPNLPNLDAQPYENRDLRGSRRYGIGYDARHGIDADAMKQDSRMQRVEHAQQHPAGGGGNASAGRGGRGR